MVHLIVTMQLRCDVLVALSALVSVAGCAPRPIPVVRDSVPVRAGDSEPPRPALPSGADTNDAQAYFDYARALVRVGSRLDTADVALYWAARLDPTSAEPLALRAVAILRALRRDLVWAALEGAQVDSGVADARLHVADSLFREAVARDPFPRAPVGLFRPTPLDRRRRNDAAALARNYFAAEEFAQAAARFGEALARHPDSVEFRLYRAHAFYFLAQYDSAIVELSAIRDHVGARERDALVPFHLSTELLEYALAIAHVRRDEWLEARAALERALIENLGFYWIHARLAGIALAQGDTVAALRDLEVAVQYGPNDAALRMFYGYVLRLAGQPEAAVTHLRAGLRLNPHAASLYLELARAYEALSLDAEALRAYHEFIAHAALRDPSREWAVRRAAALRGVPRP